MDITTRMLIEAIQTLLEEAYLPPKGKMPARWAFQDGSEIHEVLLEALKAARIATGWDRPPRLLTAAEGRG